MWQVVSALRSYYRPRRRSQGLSIDCTHSRVGRIPIAVSRIQAFAASAAIPMAKARAQCTSRLRQINATVHLSLDHIIRTSPHPLWDRYTQRFRSRQIDHEFVLGCLQNRQFRRFGAV